MAKFAQGRYTLKHPDKYVGRKTPLYRSSWEFAFMKFCDENPAIASWASEAIKIPFRSPLTGKPTVYVPDFFIQYKDKGVFIVCKSSNKSGGEIQDFFSEKANLKLYEHIAQISSDLNTGKNVCLVMGATYPYELNIIREKF